MTMTTFASVPLGNIFCYGGNVYKKQSSRTAAIIASRSYNPDALLWAVHEDYKGVWGYFAQRQGVNQELGWWRAMTGWNF